MASTNPPTIDTSTLQGTPAHEWAHDTTSALDPTYSQKSTPARPNDPDIPGAYPSEHDVGQPGVDLSASVGQIKQATVNALNTAREYLPSQENAVNAASRVVDAAREYLPAKNQVQSVTQGVVDTAKRYLPETVGEYLPGSTTTSGSLPSTEKTGAQPGEKTGGAGALPGAISESGVAVLPEERAVEAPTPQIAVTDEGVGGPSGLGGVGNSSGNEPGVAALPTDETLASKRLRELKGGSGGIGTLSWAGSDSSIAVLPDEKGGKNGASSGHVTPSRKSEVKDPQEKGSPVTDDVLAKEHYGYGTYDYPAKLQPLTSLNGRAQVEHAIADDTEKSLPPSPTSPRNGSTSAGHKPKFLDRVKGEAKIIAGKLAGNDEKIEEGKRLKGLNVE